MTRRILVVRSVCICLSLLAQTRDGIADKYPPHLPLSLSLQQAEEDSKNNNHRGPIDDATCNVEQLEEANDSQLFSILHDLKETSFFRNFAVDLDAKCPLSWNARTTLTNKSSSTPPPTPSKEKSDPKKNHDDSTSSPMPAPGSGVSGTSRFLDTFSPFDPQGDGGCPSPGLPDKDPDDDKSSCHVEFGDENTLLPMMTSTSAEQETSTVNTDENKNDKSPDEDEHQHEDGDENEEEFECTGGAMEDEIDEDAEPLCHLTESELSQQQEFYDAEYGMDMSKTPLQDLLSSALNTVNNKMGWESDSEKKTFLWSSSTDPVVMSKSGVLDEACDDEAFEGRLPDTFWLDMCSNIYEGDGIKMVDLMLNPERNTGYNGTHIWRAIYEENCIDMDGLTDQPMCYEERVMYRLLSGLHASTTLSIAKNYYPPNKKKGRVGWEPNPKYFFNKFGQHPEHIRNLHFSYVVLLRALKKAHPILSRYEIRTGNIVDDETAMVLLRRLLDSSILKSCSDVFTAFDESLMFRPQNHDQEATARSEEAEFKFPSATDHPEEVITLQKNFKGVFHNISSILDCVQCQQCKLHGKMAMLGYGTALKILFMTNEEVIASSLSRNEIVALINTVAKFSEALKEVRELTHLYWSSDIVTSPVLQVRGGAVSGHTDSFEMAINAINELTKTGHITKEREKELVSLALADDSKLLTIAKHYGDDLEKFFLFSHEIGSGVATLPDAIVVGTGLAGLAATLNILDRGGTVLVIEKEHRVGGNSNKASSGINACCTDDENSTSTDYLDSFIFDTTKSAGSAAQPELIEILTQNSWNAVTWLKKRVGVDLSLVAQLGGHQYKRTHRPSNGMVGAEIIYGMQKAVKKYEKEGQVQILTDTKVLDLLKSNDGNVTGVRVEYLSDEQADEPTDLKASNVILATGGFAADRRDGSLLSKYRPELIKMPATAGPYSTGDGIALATNVGAGLIDMDKVQVHPTGWVDPKDPTNPNKVLAGELMRGVGGILINKDGRRFCNELGTRAYVTDMMLRHDPYYSSENVWNKDSDLQTFFLVLSSEAASNGKKHVDHYMHKGLVTKLVGVQALASWMNQDVDVLKETFTQYHFGADKGEDEWGKTSFQGQFDEDLDNEVFFVGVVTPVLHYCMGGITIDKEGNVLDENGIPITGLHAAGEVTGGVHGNNRLGGNSLLECTVYGTIVGKKIPIQTRIPIDLSPSEPIDSDPPQKLLEISESELAKHNSESDCWVAIHGKVYDLTDFAESHPPGAESIYRLGGTDGTEAFQSIHNEGMLEDFEDDLIGVLV